MSFTFQPKVRLVDFELTSVDTTTAPPNLPIINANDGSTLSSYTGSARRVKYEWTLTDANGKFKFLLTATDTGSNARTLKDETVAGTSIELLLTNVNKDVQLEAKVSPESQTSIEEFNTLKYENGVTVSDIVIYRAIGGGTTTIEQQLAQYQIGDFDVISFAAGTYQTSKGQVEVIGAIAKHWYNIKDLQGLTQGNKNLAEALEDLIVRIPDTTSETNL